MIDPAFDGHPARDFASMSAEERLDDLSRKVALVLELRKSREAAAEESAACRPFERESEAPSSFLPYPAPWN